MFQPLLFHPVFLFLPEDLGQVCTSATDVGETSRVALLPFYGVLSLILVRRVLSSLALKPFRNYRTNLYPMGAAGVLRRPRQRTPWWKEWSQGSVKSMLSSRWPWTTWREAVLPRLGFSLRPFTPRNVCEGKGRC